MALTIDAIAHHLQLDAEQLSAEQEDELLFFADAAVRLIEGHRDLLPQYKPLNLDDPLMRFAVLELVRDMNSGTQSGAGGRAFGQDYAGDDGSGQFTGGRPTLPPYVEGLLQPFMRDASRDGPAGVFPVAAPWPAW